MQQCAGRHQEVHPPHPEGEPLIPEASEQDGVVDQPCAPTAAAQGRHRADHTFAQRDDREQSVALATWRACHGVPHISRLPARIVKLISTTISTRAVTKKTVSEVDMAEDLRHPSRLGDHNRGRWRSDKPACAADHCTCSA